MTRPGVTVVVVTYNARAFIGRCLESLSHQTMSARAYSVVVVDNASADGTGEIVAEQFPAVTLVRSPRNLGFGGGCELGRKQAPSDIVVLVNSDACVAHDFLEQIVEPLGESSDVAAVTGHIVLNSRFVPEPQTGSVETVDGRRWRALPAGADSPAAVDIVNSTGNAITRDGYGYDRDFMRVDQAEFLEAGREVFGFCGAAAALRTAAIEAVGGFDARYFLYYEDTDLSWRLRLAGWRVVYAATARARHIHQGSVGSQSSLHAFYDQRNRLVTVAKNASALTALTAWGRQPLSTISMARRQFPDLAEFRLRMRILASGLRLLPRTLQQRRAARKNRLGRKVVDRLLHQAPSAAELHHSRGGQQHRAHGAE